MTVRSLVAATALVLVAGAVIAAEDPIKARQAVMKQNGDQAKIAVAMVKGEAPFDLAKAKTVFTTFAASADKVKDLFPDNSKSGDDTAALPKIWEDKADFDAKLAKMGKDAKAAADSVTDLASFKANFATVGKDCGACHELYRRKKT